MKKQRELRYVTYLRQVFHDFPNDANWRMYAWNAQCSKILVSRGTYIPKRERVTNHVKI